MHDVGDRDEVEVNGKDDGDRDEDEVNGKDDGDQGEGKMMVTVKTSDICGSSDPDILILISEVWSGAI